MQARKKNYGQKSLPNLEPQLEAEAKKQERPLGCPSLGMIKSYLAQLGLTDLDAEELYDVWLANGFTLGTGRRIRDWKAAARNWYRSGYFTSQKRAAQTTARLEEQEAKRQAAIKRMKESK